MSERQGYYDSSEHQRWLDHQDKLKRQRKVVGGIAGVGAILLVGAATYLAHSESSNDAPELNSDNPNPTPSASAELLPSPSPTPTETVSPTPSPTETTSAPKSTGKPIAKDPYSDLRSKIANRYDACEVFNFTRNGRTLNIDAEGTRNPESQAARDQHKHSSKVSWTHPNLVAIRINSHGKLTGNEISAERNPRDYDPRNASIAMPTTGDTYGLYFKETATSPINNGSENRAQTNDVLCGVIKRNEDAPGWHFASTPPNLQDVVTYNTDFPANG